MSEEVDRLALELLQEGRFISLSAALHKIHQTQRQTIAAILQTLRGEPQAAFDSTEKALDYLLASQDELDRTLASLQNAQDRYQAIRSARGE